MREYTLFRETNTTRKITFRADRYGSVPIVLGAWVSRSGPVVSVAELAAT